MLHLRWCPTDTPSVRNRSGATTGSYVVILFACLAQHRAKELAAARFDSISQHSQDESVTRLAGAFVGRVHKAGTGHVANLDSTTLAKALGPATLHMSRHSPTVLRGQLRYMQASPGPLNGKARRMRGFKVQAAQSALESGLVSCDWLASQLQSPNLRILDATWFLPNSPFACPEEGSCAEELFRKGPRIPGAKFFNIDAVADTSAGLSHMLPTPEILATALAELGVSKESDVVVYDQLGIFSAPRLWYTLKASLRPLAILM
eukprot:gnl/TRDRNA2_/TRDRNA2_141745_c0_seq2.p1 gnl/TRDRNA2_/TRDRNA2_141745_c0~~gnl/TRDRNA2_/TRDRNA2_141745_c0_seq2.p1  ORF type:complete len:262 (+),score=25.69 gnl/TRDRNA2_/TRDRNA2_141745_c0_seq2:31-816(+)